MIHYFKTNSISNRYLKAKFNLDGSVSVFWYLKHKKTWGTKGKKTEHQFNLYLLNHDLKPLNKLETSLFELNIGSQGSSV